MNNDLFNELGPVELSALRHISVPLAAEAGGVLFAEGDAADAAYVIEDGEVSISIEKSGKPEEIARLGRGDFFGEMAIFENDTRAATAKAISPVRLWVVQKDDFLQLVKRQPDLAARLSSVLQSRRIELFLREQLVSATGVGARDLHVSIKGDPSLRETAFSRERYLSTVDKVLPQLLPSLRTLLFDTAACRVMVGMNNGEVRVGTVVAPFLEEVHNVNKITSPAYLARHFPAMDYDTTYGLSESTGPGCVHLGIENSHKVGAIGRPGFNWETRIVDENGKDVIPGQPGELIVRGNGVMREYYKNPEATARTLKEEWLYTGDIVRQDEEGFIFIVDRKKDVIITGGENIFPVEVEHFLHTHPAVKDVAAIGFPDERLGEVVAVVIEVVPGKSLTEAEILEYCSQFPRYKRPKKVFFGEVPRSPTGKIEKPKLRRKYAGMEEAFKIR